MQVDSGGPLVLAAAGVLAGVVGTAGGITSLVSYPALLLVGVAPLPADIANLVAGVACLPGAVITSRHELRGTSQVLRSTAPAAALAAAAGAVLLLTTPPGVFRDVVPWLVLAGSAVLLAQPRLAAGRTTTGARRGPQLPLAVGVLSIYGGYFGAASGIMLLATVLLLHEPDLLRANAVKNVLVGAGGVASAAVFVAAGPVRWGAVAPLAAGMFAGSLAGPAVARRLPATALRWGAAALGLGLAVDLLLRGR